LLVSDSISLDPGFLSDKISIVSAADLFAEAIKRTYMNESISSLFDIDKG